MISLPARLPLLQVGSSEIASYGPVWIEDSITRAARDAGHAQWFFAEDIALGVVQYLRERFPGSSISLAELFERIAATLRAIGFPDVAAQLRADPPPVEVSLAEIAREATPGFELLFFQLLDRRIDQLRLDGVSKVRFTEIETTVRLLRPRSAGASARRAALAREILAFLGHRSGGPIEPGADPKDHGSVSLTVTA